MVVGALDLSFTDGAILIGVVLFGLTKVSELRGWTRSPALVRQENADLRERNASLEAEVRRLSDADREKGEKIAALEALVSELKERDQAAVLTSIARHDEGMVRLGEALTGAMAAHERYAQERAVAQDGRHDEAMRLWGEIRDIVRDRS